MSVFCLSENITMELIVLSKWTIVWFLYDFVNNRNSSLVSRTGILVFKAHTVWVDNYKGENTHVQQRTLSSWNNLFACWSHLWWQKGNFLNVCELSHCWISHDAKCWDTSCAPLTMYCTVQCNVLLNMLITHIWFPVATLNLQQWAS